MNDRRNRSLTPFAQSLRKRMTREERKLWYNFLEELPVTFYRQKVIGNYIVDFYSASAKLVIELDGSQHYEQEAAEYDGKRDAFLTGLGLTVLRYSNLDVRRNFGGVCESILLHLTFEKVSP